MGNGIGDASQHPLHSTHPLVPDDDEIGTFLFGDPNDHVSRRADTRMNDRRQSALTCDQRRLPEQSIRRIHVCRVSKLGR
jgi:hypothetical protein